MPEHQIEPLSMDALVSLSNDSSAIFQTSDEDHISLVKKLSKKCLLHSAFASTFTSGNSSALEGNKKINFGFSPQVKNTKISIFSMEKHAQPQLHTFENPDDCDIFEIDAAPAEKTYAHDDCIKNLSICGGKAEQEMYLIRAEYNFRVGLMVAAELAHERKAAQP